MIKVNSGKLLSQSRTFSLLTALFLFSHFSSYSTEIAQSYRHEIISTKNYTGITLNILTHELPVMGEPTALHAKQFEELTGAKVVVHHVPFKQLYQEALWGFHNARYDIVFYASLWLADFYPYLAPVPNKLLRSASFVDILPYYQNIAKWQDTTYQVNIDGDRHYLQYRKSLFANPKYASAFKAQYGFDLAVPKTWQQLNKIAAFFNGQILENGQKIYGIAEVTNRNDLLFSQFIKRAAPYAKHPKVNDGFYFELSTMKPQINNPGFVEALKDFVKSSQYYPPNGNDFSLADVIKSFGGGETVFSDSWDDAFVQAMEKNSAIANKVAASLSPGSEKVWNRNTAQWDTFPNINYVPYIAWGWTSAVAKKSLHKQAAFDYLGFFTNNKNHENDVVIGRFGVNPYRSTDLREQFWIEKAGWNKAVAHSYVSMLKQMSNAKNTVFDLRIHNSRQYMKTLAIGVFRALSGRSSEQEALDYVAKTWDDLTEQIGREKQRKAYAQIVKMENNLPY